MNTRFEIEPDYADALRAAGLANFDTLFNATPSGPPTSKHRHRETVPIEFDVNGKRQRFFLKRVFRVPGQHSWRPWLRGKPGYSQPVREWDNIKMMRDAGLPVMKRVAVGERRKFGIPVQAFILVEDVGMQWTLENWLVEGFLRPPEAKHDLFSSLWWELGRIRGKMDSHGLVWRDISAKHIYADAQIQTENRIQWRFGLIDVERLECSPSVARHARSRHRQILNTMSKNLHRGDTWYYLPSGLYVDRLWQPLLDSLRPMARSASKRAALTQGYSDEIQRAMGIETPLKLLVDDSWSRFVALPLPDNFVHPRSRTIRNITGVVAADADQDILERAGIRDFDSAMALSNSQILSKPGLQEHRDRLRLVLDAGTAYETVLYLKRYRRPPRREQIGRLIEASCDHSTGYREFKVARSLLEMGIPCAVPIAYGERMNGVIEDCSFVAFREVQGESLETLARKWQMDSSSRPTLLERRQIARQLGQMVGRLHAEGWFHRDLYFSHVYLSHKADGEIVLQLIDLARVIRRIAWRRYFRWRWRVKDLAALAYSAPKEVFTRTDRMRFLEAIGYDYFVLRRKKNVNVLHQKLTRWALRRLLKDVNARVKRMARHDAKRAARFERQRVMQASSAPAERGRYP